LGLEQRTFFGIFRKFEIPLMLRAIVTLDRQLRLYVTTLQRSHGFVVQIYFGLAALIDQQFSMYPLGFLNDSTVRCFMFVPLRFLSCKSLSQNRHGKSKKYNKTCAGNHKMNRPLVNFLLA